MQLSMINMTSQLTIEVRTTHSVVTPPIPLSTVSLNFKQPTPDHRWRSITQSRFPVSDHYLQAAGHSGSQIVIGAIDSQFVVGHQGSDILWFVTLEVSISHQCKTVVLVRPIYHTVGLSCALSPCDVRLKNVLYTMFCLDLLLWGIILNSS